MKIAVLVAAWMFVAMVPNAWTQEAPVEEAAEGPSYCPVCGPHAEMEELGFMYKHDGTRYRFCSLECLKAFKNDPEKYLEAHEEGAAEDQPGHSH